MDDDMKPVDFSEFKDRKPRAPKRKSTIPSVEIDSDDPAMIAAAAVIDSTRLDNKSPEELAELVYRRMANVALLAGFVPKTLKEATEVAKAWASIASLERARKQGQGSVPQEDDEITRVARRALGQVRELQKKAQA